MLYCYTETGVKARVRDRIEKRSKAERGSIYTIYQLKDGGDSLRYRRFSSLDTLSKMGISVEGKNYEEVYSEAFNEGMSLEYLFQKFNIDRPPDFAGHSLSVSDVIVLEKPGTREAYFVDNLGFESIPDFFKGLSEPDRKEKPMDPARPLAVIESKQMSAVSPDIEGNGSKMAGSSHFAPIAFDILISEIKEKLPKRWF